MKKIISTISAIIVSIYLLIANFFPDLISLPMNSPESHITGQTEVHFIDVGQADATLIISGDDAVLIDGGANDDEEFIVNYISDLGIDKLSLVVGTHPHEDHIGGIDAVIENFNVEKVMLSQNTSDTRTFDDVITAMETHKTPIEAHEVNKQYPLDGGAVLTILGPDPKIDFSDTNDWSLILRLDVGEESILFTGDAEKPAEEALLNSGVNLDVDILQVGHHGSNTSSTKEFIDAVTPEIAVISCGYDNSYGHPHEEVLETLTNIGCSDIHVTANDGTLVLSWDEEGNFLPNAS